MHPLSRRQFLTAAAAAPMLPSLLRADAPGPPPSTGIDGFGLALHHELRHDKGNIFTSPYSISTALAMTAAGAKGATLAQMRKTLHQTGDPVEVEAAYAKLAKSLAGAGKSIQLAVANALWAQPGYPWANNFKARVTGTFQAGIHDTNFVANPEASRKTINAWVEKQTKEKIKDLMPDGSVTRDTRLVLTNAIYFKGDWLDAFDKKLTKEQPFTMLDGSRKDVPLMYRSGKIDWYSDDAVTAIRLPYKGKEISFIGLLPKNAAQFEKFESESLKSTINMWLQGLKPASDVRVLLPRFKVETKYVLNEPLKKLGMSDAFNEDKADFSGMTTSVEKLFISIVVHKAFVDVNEEGTEAAAATGVAVTPTSAAVREEPKVFRADRPFLFALRHEPTGTILFLGRYSKA